MRLMQNVDTCHPAVFGQEPRVGLLAALNPWPRPEPPSLKLATRPVKVHHSRFVKTHGQRHLFRHFTEQLSSFIRSIKILQESCLVDSVYSHLAPLSKAIGFQFPSNHFL